MPHRPLEQRRRTPLTPQEPLPVQLVTVAALHPSPQPVSVPEDHRPPAARLQSIPVILSDSTPPHRSPARAGQLTRQNGRQVQRSSPTDDTAVASSLLPPSSPPEDYAEEAASAPLGLVIGAGGDGGDGSSGRPFPSTTMPPPKPPPLPTALPSEVVARKEGVLHIVDGTELQFRVIIMCPL